MRRAANQTRRKPPMMDLFPDTAPYSTGFLDVGDGHAIYWEQSGNPDGVPVIFLHGGPGTGAAAHDRRFFDPEHYRIVIADQRGCGRSQPFGSLENNTRAALVSDIETLRQHLRVDRWHLFGGSWGSTLALSYAQAHPENVRSLILRGIFLLEAEEIAWFTHGMRMLFPEAWEQFIEPVPAAERSTQLLEAYNRILNGPDEKAAMSAAIAWCLYEAACSSLLPNYLTLTTAEQKKHALATARIEAHYFKNELIAPANSLLRGIEKIRHIPATIVQGRYDALCPMVTAYRLHLAWPEADYIVVPDGGHSELDPSIRSRLIEATENAKTLR